MGERGSLLFGIGLVEFDDTHCSLFNKHTVPFVVNASHDQAVVGPDFEIKRVGKFAQIATPQLPKLQRITFGISFDPINCFIYTLDEFIAKTLFFLIVAISDAGDVAQSLPCET